MAALGKRIDHDRDGPIVQRPRGFLQRLDETSKNVLNKDLLRVDGFGQ